MQTKTKTILALASALIAWAGVPMPSYAIDLIPATRARETWQTTVDGVTVRATEPSAIAYALARASSTKPRTFAATVTAYNSVPEQTDATPCIAANGADICKLHARGDYSCASTLPFGTKLDIPGFGVCTVRDRLAPKYYNRVDIHMGDRDMLTRARAWGKRHLTVTIIN